jgi:hypothetical protein
VKPSVDAWAIHICADRAITSDGRWWPPIESVEDTVERAQRICRHLGVGRQQLLAGAQATIDGVVTALRQACAVLGRNGTLILTFAGHTFRGLDAMGRARWCLFDGGLELGRVAQELAQLPPDARIVVISETCYATALASCLVGTQQVVVLGSCSDEQTTIIRMRSEMMVRLERFVCSTPTQGSLEALRSCLEHDTPDCERPCVWTNTESWWAAPAVRVWDRLSAAR